MEEKDTRAELIKQRLVVKESEVFERLLDRMERLVMLDEAGNVHFRIAKESLTQRHIIALYLVGKKFAEMADLSADDGATANELADFLGATRKVVSARISDLKRAGIVEDVSRGKWRARYAVIDRIIDEIERALGE